MQHKLGDQTAIQEYCPLERKQLRPRMIPAHSRKVPADLLADFRMTEGELSRGAEGRGQEGRVRLHVVHVDVLLEALHHGGALLAAAGAAGAGGRAAAAAVLPGGHAAHEGIRRQRHAVVGA